MTLSKYKKLILSLVLVSLVTTPLSYTLASFHGLGEIEDSATVFQIFGKDITVDPETVKELTKKKAADLEDENICGFNVLCYLSYLTEVIRWGVSLITAAGAGALNYSASFTVEQMGEKVRDNGGINASWVIMRDFANIILIFVLLAIGIATILRVEGYGMRQILAKLIIVAVLVNFSLFFTRVVVDVSNLAAFQFMQEIEKEKVPDTTDNGNKYGLSGVFLDTTNLETAYIKSPKIDHGEIIKNDLYSILLLLVAAFAFFAGAILLILRMVMLIILMVLSPLAFVAFILPSTSSIAKKWWSTLVNNALFAPILFALLLLSVKVLRGFYGDNTALAANEDGFFSTAAIASGELLTTYILTIGLLIASIVIAKSLGIVGGETAVKWGVGLRKFGLGLAARPAVAGGRVARRVGAALAHKIETPAEEGKETRLGRWGQTVLSSVPYLRRGIQNYARTYKEDVAEIAKKFERYGNAQLHRQLKSTISPTTRAAITKAFENKKDADELSVEQIEKARNIYKWAGMSTRSLDLVRPDAAGIDKEEMIRRVGKLNEQDIPNLHKMLGTTADGRSRAVIDNMYDAMHHTFDGRKMAAMSRKIDALGSGYIDHLIKVSNEHAGITDKKDFERNSSFIMSYLEAEAKKGDEDAATARDSGDDKEREGAERRAAGIRSQIEFLRGTLGRRALGLDEFDARKGGSKKSDKQNEETPKQTGSEKMSPGGIVLPSNAGGGPRPKDNE